jgi:hypothetical protein
MASQLKGRWLPLCESTAEFCEDGAMKGNHAGPGDMSGFDIAARGGIGNSTCDTGTIFELGSNGDVGAASGAPSGSIVPRNDANGSGAPVCETAMPAAGGFPIHPVWIKADATAPTVVINAATTRAVDCNWTAFV